MADALQRKLKTLISKKETYFQRIQLLYDKTKFINTPKGVQEFNTRYATCESTKIQFEEVVEQINLLSLEIDEKFQPNFKELNAVDELYCYIQEAAKRLSQENQATLSTPATSEGEGVPRLPKIDLVTFDGDILKFPLFYETFKCLIHENTKLNDVTKMHYLLSTLSGKAASLANGLLPTAANYSILWKSLVDKFDDKRTLATTYLSQILDFKPMQNENVNSLNLYLERIDSSVNALQKIDLTNLSDFILTTICLSKLDHQTQKLFEQRLKPGAIPTYAELSAFVREQAKILLRTNSSHSKSSFISGTNKNKVVHSFTTKENNKSFNMKGWSCILCKTAQHRLFKCSKFINLPSTERITFVKQHNLCFNCLSPSHTISFCTSPWRCQKCKSRHHSLIHSDIVPSISDSTSSLVNVNTEGGEGTTAVSLCSTALDTPKGLSNSCNVLLATAVVYVLSPFGEKYKMRFLVDSASQCHFITYKCCQRLKLPLTKTHTTVSGIGASSNRVRGQTQIQICSQYDPDVTYCMEVLVMDKISDKLPTCTIDPCVYQQFCNLKLADCTFHKAGEIDGLIGAELVPHILGSIKLTGPDLPVAVSSTLGFVVMGKVSTDSIPNSIQTYCCVDSTLSLETLMQKFWETEEISTVSTLSVEDLECEQLYSSSFRREPDGRYVVSLPFKEYPPNMGNSYHFSLRRFYALERKFSSSPSYHKDYIAAMNNYIEQGHMVSKPNCDPSSRGYYIPHHGVSKASTSTPLRIVFDAGMKTDRNVSLNDVLYTGEKLQGDLFIMLLNFRLLKIAVTSDCRQMYRQIKLCQEHQSYQRLLWRSSAEEPIQTFELTTVAFGVKSSPWLAIRTLQQLASDESDRFPITSKIMLRDTYMDDFISSIDCLDSAKTLYCELVQLFMAGGFELVKWATNSVDLLSEVPEGNRSKPMVEFSDDFLKVLGLQWHTVTDVLKFSVKLGAMKCTKRNILSTVARIWDPLGILAPVTLYAKLLIKELWILKLGWDDETPNYLTKIWENFQSELSGLTHFEVPRHIGVSEQNYFVLLGFADASEKAFGATVYMRVSDSDRTYKTTLVCAKSKVAPLKTLSVPRLELLSCLLLAKLLNRVISTYSERCSITKVYAFSDSMVALAWINDSPHRWKSFVANRVTKIQELIDPLVWFHVGSEYNPADCVSRGLSPSAFIDHSLFLFGPSWLNLEENYWPIQRISKVEMKDTTFEEKIPSLAVFQHGEHELYLLVQRSSSWTRLLNIIVYIMRFGKRLPTRNLVSSTDLAAAEMALIRVIQSIHFLEEKHLLGSGQSSSTKLRHLRPFIKDGIIRVGGRLSNSSITYDQQHPILLPKRDNFTDLLISYYHKTNLHAGPHLLLSLLRQRYWILAARGVVRRLVQRCNHCFKIKPQPIYPLMADLPSFRVNQAKAFAHTGVDYAGPFFITLSRHRGVKTQKAYLCLFVCMVTRAVHLELASDLSTDVFLAAFKRFLSRRGPCSVIYSDCGSNFIGAKNSLSEIYEFTHSSSYTTGLGRDLALKGIEWKFNPPSASHFGGIWEANVKVVKIHLSKVIGEQILSYEEFTTVLTQIEALMNSRPLCWLSSDPAEMPLTPSHFLTLTPLQFLPAHDETKVPINRLTRKQLLDQIVQSYWKRWHLEYLSGLQSRQKWNTPAFPVKRGLLVIIQKDNIPPLQWPVGIIEELFPGKDGIVRVVSVRTRDGVYKRPVIKICPLPTQ